jgi:uncharacterized delta-60 repeat protein
VDFALVRYNPDGSLDTTFGSAGKVITPIGAADDNGFSIAVDPNGKILLAGVTGSGSSVDFALVRYNADGSLDTSFDGDGKVTTGLLSDDLGQSVVVQPDGKIVVSGYSFDGSSFDFAIARYNSDGSLDTGFGSGGKVTTPIAFHEASYSVALQADGKIVAAGHSFTGNGPNDFAVIRYNANGSLDASFDGDGKVTTDFSGTNDVGQSVALQPDGKIVVAGYSLIGSNADIVVARYNSNGSLDTSFDGDGRVRTSVVPGSDYGSSVTIQPDGKILVAGNSFNGTNTDFALVRYNANGSLDTTFGNGGKVTTQIGASSEEAYSVKVQPDGKIVVAGFSNNGSNADFAVVRYNADGSLDTSFGVVGATTASGAVTEIADLAAGENATTHTATGTIAFTDVDLSDTHSASVTPQGSGYLGNLTLGSVDQAGNSVGWTFTVADSALDSLAAGEVLTQLYDVQVSDGHGGTATKTVTVTITGRNDVPTVTNASAQTTYTEGDAAIHVAAAISLSDVDDTQLEAATVWFSNVNEFFPLEDRLVFADQNGITGQIVGNELRLTGTASLSDYEVALRSVAYLNVSENPTAGQRSITFIVNDGESWSAPQSASSVQVVPVNDAPVITQLAHNTTPTAILVPESTAGSFLTVTATDAEQQPLTYSIGPSPASFYDNEVFTIDANTGALRFTTPPDFEFTDPGNDDLYKVQVTVADTQGGVATRDYFVQVTDVEENTAPTVVPVNAPVVLVEAAVPNVGIPSSEVALQIQDDGPAIFDTAGWTAVTGVPTRFTQQGITASPPWTPRPRR